MKRNGWDIKFLPKSRNAKEMALLQNRNVSKNRNAMIRTQNGFQKAGTLMNPKHLDNKTIIQKQEFNWHDVVSTPGCTQKHEC